MAKEAKRFHIDKQPGELFGVSPLIITDRETGVQYLFVSYGYGGGLTPLLGADGKPMVDNDLRDPS